MGQMKPGTVKDLLIRSGIKPSLHRMRILEYLIRMKNHPTADMIFREISGEIPTLSKTTIYNTLHTFLENGIVQAVTIEDNEVRFDADTSSHGHFKCLRCDSIYDLPLGNGIITDKTIEGHHVTEYHVYLKGICKNCQS